MSNENKKDLFSGVISEEDYVKSNPIRDIAMKIINEKYETKEINKIIDQRYFGFSSLVSLTDKEESFLRKTMVDQLKFMFVKSDFSKLLRTSCYINKEQKDVYKRGAQGLNLSDDKKIFHVMSAEEKLIFLNNPTNLSAVWHEDYCSSPFGVMGYRNFNCYKICKNFAKVVHEIKSADNKKERLRIMDLGGGVGLALNDIKKMHPELITYNATRDEEYSHYPTDFHVVAFAERMPLALKGMIDIIFSNMATRYFAYTDLVIKGCVEMLAKGGVMDVFFSSESSDNYSERDVVRRMKKAHDFLKEMESSGVIELKINNTFSSNFGGSFKSEDGTLYPAASVFCKKLI
ncbi:MAG: hypothetical protein WC842_04095 [Candidatus Paceibacterota bacterium]|jgi:hypothetical protein